MSVRNSSRKAPKRISARKNARDLSHDKRRTLKARRRDDRNRGAILFVIGSVASVAIIIYGLWRPEIRINEVHANGVEDSAVVEAAAQKPLIGTYGGILPRDSFFLYPEKEVRAAVLATSPKIAAVSVARSGFTSITLKAVPRASAFLWCGTSRDQSGPCYDTDAEGLVFALHEEAASSSPQLRVYASLTATDSDVYPLRANVTGTDSLPDILRFVKALSTLGVRIVSVGIRGDEADLYAESGTRIMYVIGTEEETARIAASALTGLNLSDGSLQYVDLRFGDKVYVKRKGE